MSRFLNEVKSRVPRKCRKERCKKEGCSINLQDMHPVVVVDMDCRELEIPGDHGRCDYVVFSSKGHKWVVPMEMKRGKVDESVTRQIQNGIDFADTRFIPKDPEIMFRPLCVTGRGVKRETYEKIKKAKVEFRGRKYKIEICRSESFLVEALS